MFSQKMKNKNFIFYPILLLITVQFFACKNRPEQNIQTDTIEIDTIVSKVEIPIDTFRNNIGNLLAGIDNQEFRSSFDSVGLQFWQQYKSDTDTIFSKLTKERFSRIENWQQTEIAPKIDNNLPLFYPFSGPDFINAYYLFPNSNDYTMIGLEKLGILPNFNEIDSKTICNYLKYINYCNRDIYNWSFYRTRSMQADFNNENDGVLPILYLFIKRLGFQISEFGYFKINENDGTFEKIDKPSNSQQTTECVRFKIFRDGDTICKTLTYFSADISNGGFVKNQALLTYLNTLTNYNTFLKSASYLLAYDYFSVTRDLIINKSNAILQDDSGIPFKKLKNDWKYHLYGTYKRPVGVFKDQHLYQNDLVEMYKSDSVKTLDFSMGYHFKNNEQSWILYLKKNPLK